MLFLFGRVDDPRNQMFGEYSTPEQWQAMGEELGLNRPLVVQWSTWVADSMRVDFGNSVTRKIAARSVAMEYVTTTLWLFVGGLALSVVFSAAAILTMLNFGRLGLNLNSIGHWSRVILPSIPPFLPGILIVLIFFPNSLLFPIASGEAWGYLLPSVALGLVIAYAVVRQFDTARYEHANSDHSLQDLTSGPGRRGTSSRRMARGILLGALRSTHVYLPVLLAAVIFTELIFGLRGLSSFTSPVTLFEDFPLAATGFMMFTIAYVVVMLLMDVARAYVDPLVRTGSADIFASQRLLVSYGGSLPSKTWPLFGHRPLIALVMLGIILVLSLVLPSTIDFRGGLSASERFLHIFISLKHVFIILAIALFSAAIIGGSAAFAAIFCGRKIDLSLVWIFELFTAFPILLLGLAASYTWITSPIFSYFSWNDPVTYTQAPVYPAAMLAIIVSGVFFHQVRANARMFNGHEGVFSGRVVRGLLAAAATSAGPVVMLSAVFGVAGVYWAAGWAGPFVTAQYSLNVSIWWTLLPALVLILTILSLNFLGAWVRERLDHQPDDQENGLAEAHIGVLEANGK